jgi:hypothetical protein
MSLSGVDMNKILSLTMILFSLGYNVSAQANETERAEVINYVDITKGLEWLTENTTRIYSLVTEVEYIDDVTKKVIPVQSEFTAPMSAEGCESFDVDNKYSNYFYYNPPAETTDPKKAPYSSWFEGRKLPGKVISKKITYCFAN